MIIAQSIILLQLQRKMNWTIQDVFDKSANGGNTTVAQVDAVATLISGLGYVVECGVWDNKGELTDNQTDWLAAGQWRGMSLENNYVIFSIRRQSGEYVYGSVEPPVAEREDCKCTPRWSDAEVDQRWPLSGHRSLPQYLADNPDDLILGPGKTLSFGQGYFADRLGVAGCGLPDWRNLCEFVNIFYLDGRVRSSYQTWHVEQLLRDHTVNTISNTLPPDIVEALLRFPRSGRVWEFMVVEDVDDTIVLTRTRCYQLASVIGKLHLPEACPCNEGVSPKDSDGIKMGMAVEGRPQSDSVGLKLDDSGSSSDDDQ